MSNFASLAEATAFFYGRGYVTIHSYTGERIMQNPTQYSFMQVTSYGLLDVRAREITSEDVIEIIERYHNEDRQRRFQYET